MAQDIRKSIGELTGTQARIALLRLAEDQLLEIRLHNAIKIALTYPPTQRELKED